MTASLDEPSTSGLGRLPRPLAALWWPTPRLARTTAAVIVAVLGLVVVTGAAVRLSGSGLGCPTWPTCSGDSLHSGLDVHGLIEFGNRVLSAVVFLAGIAVLALVVWRARRRDVYRQVAGLFGGYLAEAVLGGFTVLTRLNPLLVGAHFLLALGLLWLALVVYHRLGSAPVAAVALVGPELRWIGRALVAGAGAIIVVGTLVTGSGPYAGSRVDNRLPFARRDITQLHSDLVLFLVGAVLVMLLTLRVVQAPAAVQRRGRWVLIVLVCQAGIGFLQYFTGLPAWLVGIHVAGATVFWGCCLMFALGLSERPHVVERSAAAPAALAALPAPVPSLATDVRV